MGRRGVSPWVWIRCLRTSTAAGGDSLTLFSSWARNGAWQVESVVPYGASDSAVSPHYADQAPLFAAEKLKSVPLSNAALMAEATATERPKPPPPKKVPAEIR